MMSHMYYKTKFISATKQQLLDMMLEGGYPLDEAVGVQFEDGTGTYIFAMDYNYITEGLPMNHVLKLCLIKLSHPVMRHEDD